jgi:hypothetical protein
MSLSFQPFPAWTCGSQGAVPSPVTEKVLVDVPRPRGEDQASEGSWISEIVRTLRAVFQHLPAGAELLNYFS